MLRFIRVLMEQLRQFLVGSGSTAVRRMLVGGCLFLLLWLGRTGWAQPNTVTPKTAETDVADTDGERKFTDWEGGLQQLQRLRDEANRAAADAGVIQAQLRMVSKQLGELAQQRFAAEQQQQVTKQLEALTELETANGAALHRSIGESLAALRRIKSTSMLVPPVVTLLLAIAIVLVGILVFRLHACLALLFAALVVSLLTPVSTLEVYADKKFTSQDWTRKTADKFVLTAAPERVASGFGTTCGKIGIVIAMASIIGLCLLESGAADRIVRSTLNLVGEAKAGASFVVSSFVLGIPVFFDTVFYLMIPLGKTLRLKSGGNYVLYILAIIAGGSMAHSLVPPTPGPLVVASQLKVDLLSMIGGGCLVGCFSATCGYGFAVWLNRRLEIPLRDSSEAPLSELEKSAARSDADLPPLWLALLPIMLPVLMIAIGRATDTYYKTATDIPAWMVALKPTFTIIGSKNFSLIMAAIIAILTVVQQKKRRGESYEIGDSLQKAFAGAGSIILITAAGGAFGEAVRQGGIADVISQINGLNSPWVVLPVAFLITTTIRTAQGSSTVAMITAANLLQGLIDSPNFPVARLYVALAIGCGSKPIAWMADSGFWVICKMSGMTEAEGLRTITPMSIVMGVSGLVATLALAVMWP